MSAGILMCGFIALVLLVCLVAIVEEERYRRRMAKGRYVREFKVWPK